MSKDYSAIEGTCRDFAKACYDKGYERGCIDAYDSAEHSGYVKGLNDAWNVFTRVVRSKKQGGLNSDEMISIFHTTIYEDITKLSPQEAVKKLKAWEEEQAKDSCKKCPYNDGKPHAECVLCDKQTEDKIKVGDEVECKEPEFKEKGVVTRIDYKNLDILTATGDMWNCVDITKCQKTGRYFSEISKVLKQMGGEE